MLILTALIYFGLNFLCFGWVSSIWLWIRICNPDPGPGAKPRRIQCGSETLVKDNKSMIILHTNVRKEKFDFVYNEEKATDNYR
jgi:hypothetical protein